MVKNKWASIGVGIVLIVILTYAGYMHTHRECEIEIEVNDVRIPNLLLQSSLHPYAIVDMEIYNFKFKNNDTEMFAYFPDFDIYANDKLIGSEKESEEEIWSVKADGKKEAKIYLNVTGERLAELLKKSEYLTLKGKMHIYGYTNETLPWVERSEKDMKFKKRIKPTIYDYGSSYALNKPENVSEEVLRDAEDILHRRLVCFNVIDYYFMRNNSCIRIFFGNVPQGTINDVCRQGKIEFRSKTNPMDRIEIGMALSEVQNITEHVLSGDDIESVGAVPFRSTIKSLWGVSFQLSEEGAEKVMDAVKRYEYYPEYSEAYFHLLMLIDDKVVSDMPLSSEIFREFLRGKPVYNIGMEIGYGEAGRKKARKLITYLENGPLPFKMEVEK